MAQVEHDEWTWAACWTTTEHVLPMPMNVRKNEKEELRVGACIVRVLLLVSFTGSKHRSGRNGTCFEIVTDTFP